MYFPQQALIIACTLLFPLFQLVVGFIGVDAPDGEFAAAFAGYSFYRFYRCHHRVIHIIIPMLSVASDAPQVIKAVQPVPHFRQLLICSEICGVGFGDSFEVEVKHP